MRVFVLVRFVVNELAFEVHCKKTLSVLALDQFLGVVFVEQIASCHPNPPVANLAHRFHLQLLGHHEVLLPHLLERILSHELLKVFALRLEGGCFECLNIRALHAQSDEDLAAFVKGSPSLLREGEALVLLPELVANVVKINFLYDLKAELRLALLAFASD